MMIYAPLVLEHIRIFTYEFKHSEPFELVKKNFIGRFYRQQETYWPPM